MKIAVLGTGTTGSEVINILNEGQIIGPFNTDNRPAPEKLRRADAAIIFVPGSAVDEVLDSVLKAKIPAAWGSTGYDWPHEKLDDRLQKQGTKWVRASNFSLGMNIARRCLNIIGEGAGILNDPSFSIHEIHHTRKKDAPSGTALSWEKWLGRDADITSERKGDIKGIHQLTLETGSESIFLQHKAHDRKIFAEGALWAVQQLSKPEFEPGFYTMETLFDQQID